MGRKEGAEEWMYGYLLRIITWDFRGELGDWREALCGDQKGSKA